MMDEWMGRWMDEWVGGWMDGQMIKMGKRGALSQSTYIFCPSEESGHYLGGCCILKSIAHGL